MAFYGRSASRRRSRQLGEVRRRPPRLIAGQPVGSGAALGKLLTVESTRVEDLALMWTLYCGDVGLRDGGRSETRRRVHAEFHHRFFHPWRADGIYADLARHLKRSGAHETFEASVDH